MDADLKSTLKKMRQCNHEITLSRRLLSNSYNIEEIEKIEAEIRKKQKECDKLKSDNKNIK